MALSLDGLSAKSHKGPRCTVWLILNAMSDEDRATLQGVLDDPRYESSQIARVLTSNGHRVADGTVSKHRRKGCACER